MVSVFFLGQLLSNEEAKKREKICGFAVVDIFVKLCLLKVLKENLKTLSVVIFNLFDYCQFPEKKQSFFEHELQNMSTQKHIFLSPSRTVTNQMFLVANLTTVV